MALSVADGRPEPLSRPEKTLLVLAAVLLLAAWGLCFDTTPPNSSWVGGEVPWPQLLWQFKQALTPPLALVGLASGIGVLFLRAVHWEKRPALSEPTTPVE